MVTMLRVRLPSTLQTTKNSENLSVTRTHLTHGHSKWSWKLVTFPLS